MSDLVAWLRAQLDEDERVAGAAAEEGRNWRAVRHGSVWAEDGPDPAFPVVYDEGRPLMEQAEHIARHDPARVLREVAAKRAIVDRCDDALPADMHFLDDVTAARAHAALIMLGYLASVYADRDGYREEWRP